MPLIQIIYLLLIFCVVFGFSILLIRQISPSSVKQRLQRLAGENGPIAADLNPENTWIARVVKLSTPLAKLSIPEEGWEQSALRTRFMNAGFRGPHVQIIYFGAKTLLASALPILVWLTLVIFTVKLTTSPLLLCLLVAAAIGFYLPNLILSKLIALRKRAIFESFPDALDLLTVCIEAGLAMDAAIARVAEEMAGNTPVISEEFHIVTLELRAGSSKEKALRNLAMRTGVEDVDTLVAMLIQAERFGTSIADSLRVHSESLRIKRRQMAEECAAKIALKLLFPLIFCIFPALLLVLLGPAVIQIYRTLLPGLGS